MLDIQQAMRGLASRTSRRGILARLGTGLVAGSLLAVAARPQRAAANCGSCGGCGGQNCGDTGGSCCPNCAGTPCTGVTGGNCPIDTFRGWYWYCCVFGDLVLCQDCCDLQDSSFRCMSRGGVGFC